MSQTLASASERDALAPQRRIGSSDLRVYPLAISGNVFGWTAGTVSTHAILDAYADGGGNFVDTAVPRS
jgi:aryl-alcohol dehydrogenase-like predicted oxidoreductase